MNLPSPVLFRLTCEPEELVPRLGSSVPLAVEAPPNAPRIFLDTFDGRLHRAGWVLSFTPGPRSGSLELEALDGAPVRRARASTAPIFASDLPRGPLAEMVASKLGPRRLLPLAELRGTGSSLRILDDLDKTVVRIEVLAGTVAPPDEPSGDLWPWPGPKPPTAPMPAHLLVRPVRGYDDAFEAALKTLEGELDLPRADSDLLTVVLEVLGRGPRDYSSKLDLSLDPDTPAAEAARTIHRTLLATVRANLRGTRRDLDPEFLHDLRVAVRRTRSALGQIQGVFPPEDVERFKKELRWLGRATGPMRDLDVYQLKLPGYRSWLDPRVRPHLDPLHTFLDERRRSEQRKLARLLGTQRLRKLLADWEAFLDAATMQDDDMAPPNAQRPIREVASERIWKTWRRVRKRGQRIEPESPAEDLHRLRIDCKKLRYLLEFFRSLYPAGEIDPAIGALKKLQDNLGDFNDYQVQQERLESFADGMVDVDLAPVPTLLAMGRLLKHLAGGQERERRRFEKRFRRFASKKNRRRFKSLFRGEDEGEDEEAAGGTDA